MRPAPGLFTAINVRGRIVAKPADELFALKQSYALLVRLVEKGAADLSGCEDDQLDFDCVREVLGEPSMINLSKRPT